VQLYSCAIGVLPAGVGLSDVAAGGQAHRRATAAGATGNKQAMLPACIMDTHVPRGPGYRFLSPGASWGECAYLVQWWLCTPEHPPYRRPTCV